MVTSVERGRTVDVSGDERGLLFPHCVVPHPSDTTLHTGGRDNGRQGKAEERKRSIDDGGKEGENMG